MATFSASGTAAVNNNLLWVSNLGVATNESFHGIISDTGPDLLGLDTRTVVYSEFCFESAGISYRYLGEWTVTATNGDATGTVQASGSYNSIIMEDGDAPVAIYEGSSLPVDFGLRGDLPCLDLCLDMLDIALGPLFSGAAASGAYVNLNLDATPDLPEIAFVAEDALSGGIGSDILVGYDSSDYLSGGAGTDHLEGGAGDDNLFGGLAADVLVGGSGFDFARYDVATAGVVARLDLNAGSAGEATGDTYDSIEGLVGSDYADVLVGDDGYNQLLGGGGNDVLHGEDGDDLVLGGAGNDALHGGKGTDALVGGSEADAFMFEATDLAYGVWDVVKDFEDGLDSLNLFGWSVSDWAVIQRDNDVMITTESSGHTTGIIVQNATVAQVIDQAYII